ncbi:NHL repeat-containing protein [Flammeovirga kamogawensis]|uniref:hypothetical protein n=2 Tax=Flammeovirga kamogawensis TaxID=373891 RepID=UPI001195C17E|nr:hypothetical protein [Flammeovirga kamogawensis]TRX65419.1 hypothetical protein EO216_23130 [Flammeovirga kamogawensis]
MTTFISGILISNDILKFESQLPLSLVNGILVNQKGNIYVGSEFYGKIQSFDKNGRYICNWNVNSGGGVFKMQLMDNQNILVVTARGNKKLIYDGTGNLVSEEIKGNYYYNNVESNKKIYKVGEDEKYEVVGTFFPKIVKSSKTKFQIIVAQSYLLNIIQAPFPSVIIIAIGVILSIALEFLIVKSL